MPFHSQAGQDQWVIEQHGTEPGFFVDVGAHDGIVHSNTYALERDWGWVGICIEPNVAAFASLTDSRTAECVCAAASARRGDLRMTGDVIDGHGPTTVKAVTLADVLRGHVGNVLPHVDYLSIDVEGHELEVLAGMDFDRYYVKLLTIEHNIYCDGPSRKNAIYEIMAGHGFERVRENVVAEGYGPYEDWFRNGTTA